jgi:hypothetical protein
MTGWTQAYRIVIGVAGANSTKSGKFMLELWTEPR